MKRHRYGIVAMAVVGLVSTAGATEIQPPTVVELFTSQGCSSCPPANENLIKLSERPDVLTLSFAVTYWDYLGWKDTDGKAEFTQRQINYEASLEQTGPYTPQIVVNGSATVVGNDLAELRGLVDTARPLQGPNVSLKQGVVQIGQGKHGQAADIWLVRYDPKIESVPVGRGENAGNVLRHTHVVRGLTKLGTWDGSAASFRLPTQDDTLQSAILVQRNHGEILSALAF